MALLLPSDLVVPSQHFLIRPPRLCDRPTWAGARGNALRFERGQSTAEVPTNDALFFFLVST